MFDQRRAGVLMHISSLPSKYGIGVFDQNCLDFADTLCVMGFRYWQVLPFQPVDGAGSPYCSASAFAGNLLFIDPEGVRKLGLCDEADVRENIYPGTPYTADYAFAQEKRMMLLRKAFSRADKAFMEKVEDFAADRRWLRDYAYFMALKEQNAGTPWWEWSEDQADYRRFLAEKKESFEEEANFWKFCQYLFFFQWQSVKDYINQKGIAVIGDMPMYVAMDSADVWAGIENFAIDPQTRRPEKVAGVPPDYFSADGQLWGNPLYRWDQMKKDGYSWWISRLNSAFALYDAVRIDHFRAFASYWAVPAESKTAKNGVWEKGPGMSLFRRVFEAFPDAPILAEDLGVFGEDVVKLLSDTGFPGMKVVQFGFDPGADSLHLAHHVVPNSFYYVGTHDNNTLLGWLWEASESERRFALSYVGFDGDNWGDGGYRAPACRKVIETVWRSAANTVIISFQDLCGFGADARMNIPGVPEKNWRFRTTKETIDGIDQSYFQRINALFRRLYPLPGKESR